MAVLFALLEPAVLRTLNYLVNPISLTCVGGGFSISQPSPNPTPAALSSPTSESDPGSVAVPLEASVPSAAGTPSIKWMTTPQYSTSGGMKAKFPDGQTKMEQSFTSSGNNSVGSPPTFTGQGGQLTVVATLGTAMACVAMPIVGTQIADCTISDELNGMYTSVNTSSIMPKLDVSESSYQQFSTNLLTLPKFACQLSPISSLWPVENQAQQGLKAGTYIGLMMVPVNEMTAWNWVTNATTGVNTFKDKLSVALAYQQKVAEEGQATTAEFIQQSTASGCTICL